MVILWTVPHLEVVILGIGTDRPNAITNAHLIVNRSEAGQLLSPDEADAARVVLETEDGTPMNQGMVLRMAEA